MPGPAPHGRCVPQELQRDSLRPRQPAVPGGRPDAAGPPPAVGPGHRAAQPGEQHGGPAAGPGPQPRADTAAAAARPAGATALPSGLAPAGKQPSPWPQPDL